MLLLQESVLLLRRSQLGLQMADLSLAVDDLHLLVIPLFLYLVHLLLEEVLRFECLVFDFHSFLVVLDSLLVELGPQLSHAFLLCSQTRIGVLELQAELVRRLEQLVGLLFLRADVPAESIVVALEVKDLLELIVPFLGLGQREIAKLQSQLDLLVLHLRRGTGRLNALMGHRLAFSDQALILIRLAYCRLWRSEARSCEQHAGPDLFS